MANGRKATGIIMAVLIMLCAISNIFLLTRPEVRAIPKIGTVLNLFALASAVVYCISGYRKQSQIYYKGFFLFYALHLLTGTVGMIMDFKASAMAAAWVLAFEITFANLMILLVSENLGAKKSKTIALLNTCIWAGFLIHHFIFKSHTIGIYTIRILSYFMSAILITVLIYAKYADKKERKPFAGDKEL